MNFPRLSIVLLGTLLTGSAATLTAQTSPTPTQINPGAVPNPTANPNPGSAMSGVGGMTPDTGMMDQSAQDRLFLHNAAEGGLAEVQFGQLAAQKANSPDVKAFAQKMVDDHTQLNNTIAPIARSKGVSIPTSLNKKDKAEYDKLNALSGEAFDKEYLAFMVKDHHKDLRDFRAEAASTTDPQLKQAVTNGARVIQQHTAMADKLARDNGLNVPSHGM